MANIMRLGGGGGGKPKKLLSSLTEGSLVSVLENGKLVPFYVAKHNYESDLNGEGRTLLVRKDLHSNMAWSSPNSNAYVSSGIDAWLNGDYADMLSPELRANIGVTSFYYTIGGGDRTLTTLGKSIFLLSAAEIGASSPNYFNAEGSLLPIASALVSATPANGTERRWWTRTPEFTGSVSVIYIDPSVSAIHGGVASTTQLGVRPAFTLPADMALRETPYDDGSWGLADEGILFDTETATTAAKAGVAYTNGIADLTPEQLNEIAAAISANPNIDKYMGTIYYDKGDVHRKISTGDQNTVTFNGGNYAIDIIGFNHDDLSNGAAYGLPTATGKAGMTFQMHDCYVSKNAMNSSNTNSGGWASSVMRKTNMPFFLDNLSPGEFKSVIKAVNKLTSAGGGSAAIGVTEDYFFLLSEVELFGTVGITAAGEGAQYAYYKAGNSKIKKLSGSDFPWWLRSPSLAGGYQTTAFAVVNASGAILSNRAIDPYGTAVAYCI